MGKNGFLPIGKIVGAHGIKGNIKAYSYAESLSVYEQGGSILIINSKGVEINYKIKWIKPHNRFIILSLQGIEDRNSAESLIGSELFVEQSKLPELADGSYYWFDIIGLSVYSHDDQYIGLVESIISTGSNDVYVVKDPKKGFAGETLIPALESVVLEIDLKRKTMRVDLPEGL